MDTVDIVKSYLGSELVYTVNAWETPTQLGISNHTICIDKTWVNLYVAEHGLIVAGLFGKNKILYSDPEFGNEIRGHVRRWIEIQHQTGWQDNS